MVQKDSGSKENLPEYHNNDNLGIPPSIIHGFDL
jgi:hypothetical protein